jgi:hypothetical protein
MPKATDAQIAKQARETAELRCEYKRACDAQQIAYSELSNAEDDLEKLIQEGTD